MSRILVAEDDPLVGGSVEEALRGDGHATLIADNGETAQSLSLTGEFDLLILDMGLPAREGFHVLQELRARGNNMPVVVLTGQSERDVVTCLQAGADDYIRKPFDIGELRARVRAHLRNRAGAAAADANVIRAGDIQLDVRLRRATRGGQAVQLTAREFSVFEALLRHAGQIMSRRQLLSHAWGDAFDTDSNVVDVVVSALRNKLGADVVETVRGAGYRLTAR
jgi:DNA-binding response OmpR family regulator